jgi:glycosyltransferase involved in cell wall biosynthesis
MSTDPIRFSVLLPVRNGGSYLKICVQSILSQTYPHFELHVLDNASSDDTVAWLTGLKDSRVHIWQSPYALSIEDSWARIKHVPKQEYMTFLGHDDLFDLQYLETAKSLIERYPDASLYETGSRLINAQGETIRPCHPVSERETAAQYLEARLTYRRDALGTGFVMRSKDYDRLGGIPPFERLLFADDALWLSLAKLSWKAADPREALSIRIHEQSESASMPSTWRSILLGLDQFTDFLERFIKDDEPSRNVYRSLGPSFLVRYHRNVYIYALMEACQKGERIDPAILRQIESILARKTSGTVSSLPWSFPVKALEVLNHSLFRSQVDRLWKIYYRLRTNSL